MPGTCPAGGCCPISPGGDPPGMRGPAGGRSPIGPGGDPRFPDTSNHTL